MKYSLCPICIAAERKSSYISRVSFHSGAAVRGGVSECHGGRPDHCLEELNKETGETIHLGVLNDDSLIYVAKLESTQAVRIISRIGKTAPLYCTGLGKAMLAIFSDEELERYLAKTRFEKYTTVLLSRFRPTENCAGPLAKCSQVPYGR